MQVFKLKITEKQEPLHMSNFNQYSHRLQLVMFFFFSSYVSRICENLINEIYLLKEANAKDSIWNLFGPLHIYSGNGACNFWKKEKLDFPVWFCMQTWGNPASQSITCVGTCVSCCKSQNMHITIHVQVIIVKIQGFMSQCKTYNVPTVCCIFPKFPHLTVK